MSREPTPLTAIILSELHAEVDRAVKAFVEQERCLGRTSCHACGRERSFRVRRFDTVWRDGKEHLEVTSWSYDPNWVELGQCTFCPDDAPRAFDALQALGRP